MGQAGGTGEGRSLRLEIYIWSTDKCNCSLLLNCLGDGVLTPSNLLAGRFRIGQAVLSSVEAVFVGIAFGIGLYY